jgi:hypothetical protein
MAGISDEQMFGPPTQLRLVMMVPIMTVRRRGRGRPDPQKGLAVAPVARQTGGGAQMSACRYQ